MREIIGFHTGDSILAPGGSISNMYALIIARHRFYPQHKHHGMRAIKEHLVVYTSEDVRIFFVLIFSSTIFLFLAICTMTCLRYVLNQKRRHYICEAKSE